MNQSLPGLFYSAGLDVANFENDILQIESNIDHLGLTATDVFNRKIAQSLAKSIDPSITKRDLDVLVANMSKFGADVEKEFKKAFGAVGAKEAFLPFESELKRINRQAVESLYFKAGIDTSKLSKNVDVVLADIHKLGETGKKVFLQDLGRSLARSIDPNSTKADVRAIEAQLKGLSKTAHTEFSKTFSKQSAQSIFSPFEKEANTFAGRLKKTLVGSFSIESLALGGAAALGVGQLIDVFGRGISASQKFATEFEYAVARVRSIAGKDFSEFQITKDLERIAKQVPQDLITLSNGLFNLITNGIRNVSDATKVLEIAAKTATASGTQADVISRGITKTINAFNFSIDQAQRISDNFFKTVDYGSLTMESYVNAIGDVAPEAAMAGVSLEQLSASMAFLSKTLTADEAATALRSLLLQIQAPGPKAQALAKSLGIDLSKAGLEAAGSLSAFVKQIEQATNGSAKLLFGISGNRRAFRALARMAGETSDTYQTLANEQITLNKISGRSLEAFGEMEKTYQVQSKLLKDSLAVAFKDVGEFVNRVTLPAIIKLNEILSDQLPLEKTIQNLEKIKYSADSISQLQDVLKAQQARKNVEELKDEINDLIATLEQPITTGAGSVFDLFFNAVYGKDLGKKYGSEFAKNIDTAEGLAKAYEELDKQLKLYEEINVRISKKESGGLNDEEYRNLLITRDAFEERITILSKIANYGEELKKQHINESQAITDLARKRAGLLTISEEEALVTQKKAKLENELAQSAEDRKTSLEEFKADLAKSVEDAEKLNRALNNDVELANATNAIAKQATIVRQQAEDKKTMYQLELSKIDEISAKIKKQRDDNIASFTKAFNYNTSEVEKSKATQATKDQELAAEKEIFDVRIRDANALFEEQTKLLAKEKEQTLQNLQLIQFREYQSLDKIFGKKSALAANYAKELSGQVILPALESKGAFELDESGLWNEVTRTFTKLNNEVEFGWDETAQLFALGLHESLSESETGMDKILALVDSRLVSLGRSITSFTDGLSSADPIGIIGSWAQLPGLLFGAKSALDSLFGIKDSEQKKLENERKIAEAEAKAAEKAREFEQSLNELSSTLDDRTISDLNSQYGDLENQIKNITGLSEIWTNDQLSAYKKLIYDISDVDRRIDSLLRSERLSFEQEKELYDLQAQYNSLLLEQQELLDKGLKNLSASEIESLNSLTAQADILQEKLNSLAPDTHNFTKALDKLQFQWEYLDISDPVKKFEMLREELGKLGFTLPESINDLKDWTDDIFRAVSEKSGSELRDYLLSTVGSLEADEIEDFILKLKEFTDGVAEQTGKLVDVYDELFSNLQLEFDLFDIDDPLKKLEKIREDLQDQFGALIPVLSNDIDAFIREGFRAVQGGASAVQDLLENLNLEELTADQFKDLLKTLESLADEAYGKVEAIDSATSGIEDIGASLTRSITYEQGNQWLNEATNSRMLLAEINEQINEIRNFISSGGFGALDSTVLNSDLLSNLLNSQQTSSNKYFFIVEGDSVREVDSSQLDQIEYGLATRAEEVVRSRGL